MSLLDDPDAFRLFGPFIVIEDYSRDGGHENPRHRIELRAPLEVQDQAVDFMTGCAACGTPIRPFRQRNGVNLRGPSTGGVYFASACDLQTNIGCSRTQAAADEYLRIIAAVRALPTPPVPPSTLDLMDELEQDNEPESEHRP